MTLGIIRVFLHKMSTTCQSLFGPTNVRGMKVLDRSKFACNIQIPILKVKLENVRAISAICNPYYVKVPNFRPVQDTNDDTYPKCVHLNPEKINNWEDFTEDDIIGLQRNEVSKENFSKECVQFGYDNWTYDTIFKAVLPEGEDIISSYSQIGHIIHLNLKEHLLEYRELIGQVMVDKIKHCRTVVNKTNIIDNTYRNFTMEVLAGERDYMVTVKENGCNFKFDFSKVYWNPRLGKEHERVIQSLNGGDVLFDVFCGVGPFSVPAAKRRCTVFANDLNPESFKWLNYNMEKNTKKTKFYKTFNMDGKDFILNVFKDYIIDVCKGVEKMYGTQIHVTMNLPAMAVEFLKYFTGLLKDTDLVDKFNLDIFVYVYCFAFGDESETAKAAKQMVIDNIGYDVTPNIVEVSKVRRVAPSKDMMRVKFRLTKDILFDLNKSKRPGEFEDPPTKKMCVDV